MEDSGVSVKLGRTSSTPMLRVAGEPSFDGPIHVVTEPVRRPVPPAVFGPLSRALFFETIDNVGNGLSAEDAADLVRLVMGELVWQ